MDVALGNAPAGAAEEKASPAAVAAGLEKIQGIAADSAKSVGKDNAKAEQLHSGIEPEWEKIEGTVRANDSAAYGALEDSFTLLKIAAKGADASKAAKAADSLSAAVAGYLGQHPAPEASPAPSEAGGSRTADAAEATSPAAPTGTLARTGGGSGPLGAFAGMALGLGGLALIGGARRAR
jgi:hypothetical protein